MRTQVYSDRTPEETWDDNVAPQATFCGAPLVTNLDQLTADVAFIGVPFGQGSHTGGAHLAPNAIRNVHPSYQYWGSPHGWIAPVAASGYYSIHTDSEHLKGMTMADCGNISIVRSDVDRNFWKVTRVVSKMLERGALVVAFGGDHSITPAVVRAYHKLEYVDIIHFDAHLDYTDQYQGVRWNSSTAIRRCAEFPWVRNITHIGIRAANRPRQVVDQTRARGNRIITAEQLKAMGPQAAMEQVPESAATYVTIDIDVMDPSVAPATDGPEPGGLYFYEMRDALRELVRRCRVVGIDMVEVYPNLDNGRITSKMAAHLVIELLAAIHDASSQGQNRKLA